MDAAWKAITSAGDWRNWSGEMPGVLGAIDQASRVARGEHMARVLIELVERGERVFAVVGSGHVIRQEWALRSALGAEPASDQPLPER
jgi:uridylate kinase